MRVAELLWVFGAIGMIVLVASAMHSSGPPYAVYDQLQCVGQGMVPTYTSQWQDTDREAWVVGSKFAYRGDNAIHNYSPGESCAIQWKRVPTK